MLVLLFFLWLEILWQKSGKIWAKTVVDVPPSCCERWTQAPVVRRCLFWLSDVKLRIFARLLVAIRLPAQFFTWCLLHLGFLLQVEALIFGLGLKMVPCVLKTGIESNSESHHSHLHVKDGCHGMSPDRRICAFVSQHLARICGKTERP